MPSKFCCNCTNWENVNKGSKNSQGICHDVIVASKVTILDQSFTPNGELFTNGYFGCIYWRENDGSIVDFNDIIDEEGKPIEVKKEEFENALQIVEGYYKQESQIIAQIRRKTESVQQCNPSMRLMDSGVSCRALNVIVVVIRTELQLRNIDDFTIGHLLQLSESDFKRTRNCGNKTLTEIKTFLANSGYTLRQELNKS